MIDSNMHALSARLTQMTPQQRQQYVAQHRNDPNAAVLLSLTKFVTDSENALRQRMQSAQAAQAGAPQQPVADEVIAGLAALPADNMTGIPENGILAEVPDDGDMPDMDAGPEEGYNEGGSVYERWKNAGGARPQGVPAYQTRPNSGLLPDKTGYEGMGIGEFLAAFGDRSQQKFSEIGDSIAGVMSPLVSEKHNEERLRNRELAQEGRQRSAYVPRRTPGDGKQQQGENKDIILRNADRAVNTATNAPAAAPATASSSTEKTSSKESASAGLGAILGVGGGGGKSGGAGMLDAAKLNPKFDVEGEYGRLTAGLKGARGDISKQTKELGELGVRNAREQYDETVRRQAEDGTYGKEREARLRAREGRLDEDVKENRAMAILNAGLAMMAGESPHAMVNIGKGAQVGTAAYSKGKERIDAARERVEDALMQLEDIRHREKKENSKELQERKSAITAAFHKGASDLLALSREEYGITERQQTDIFKGLVAEARAHQDGNIKIAGANQQAGVSMRGQDMDFAGRQLAANAAIKSASMRAAGAGGTDTKIKDVVASADRNYKAWFAQQSEGLNGIKWQQLPPEERTKIEQQQYQRFLKQAQESHVRAAGGAAHMDTSNGTSDTDLINKYLDKGPK